MSSDLVERLRSNEPLPVCPYDRRSPDYWTAPDDKPCIICGGLNEVDAPDLCRGADTRLMKEAAVEIERLRAIVRVNGLRWGYTHAEIDAALLPTLPGADQ